MPILNFDLLHVRGLASAAPPVMSILRYFKRDTPSHPLLPKPRSSAEESANAAVLATMEGALQRKRRGVYNYYEPDLRAKIGRYAAENGNKAAVSHFTVKLGRMIPESTVRGMKSIYLRELESGKDPRVRR